MDFIQAAFFGATRRPTPGWPPSSPSAGPRRRESSWGQDARPPDSTSRPAHFNEAFRSQLRQAGEQTRRVLPRLLRELGTTAEAEASFKYTLRRLTRLDPQYCPSFPHPATIQVLNEDTLNAAIHLTTTPIPTPTTAATTTTTTTNQPHTWIPLILNCANDTRPGGDWLAGAPGQEETLCYRTSLPLSLHPRHYPLADGGAVYSPYVLVARGDLASGHALLRGVTTATTTASTATTTAGLEELPVLAAVSVSAVPNPLVRTFVVSAEDDSDNQGGGQMGQMRPPPPEPHQRRHRRAKHVFARDAERAATKDRMRVALRLAAYNRHRRLVLGALGCGAACGSPPEDVAHCWLEVLREDEFSGRWWSEVCFAVYDPGERGCFEAFRRVLDGKRV